MKRFVLLSTPCAMHILSEMCHSVCKIASKDLTEHHERNRGQTLLIDEAQRPVDLSRWTISPVYLWIRAPTIARGWNIGIINIFHHNQIWTVWYSGVLAVRCTFNQKCVTRFARLHPRISPNITNERNRGKTILTDEAQRPTDLSRWTISAVYSWMRALNDR